MDWRYGSLNDDLVVPVDQEPLERIPSLDSLKWGDPSNSKMREGLYSGSLMWTTTQHEQDYMLSKDQDRINHMDDIFFDSLLKDDPTMPDNPNSSSIHSLESDYETILSDDAALEPIFDSHYIPSQAHSSNHQKEYDLFPSVGCRIGEVPTTSSLVQRDGLNDYSRQEASLEELVLQDLERVATQFSEKTRICFRDALYRLAENSKQTINSNNDGVIIMEPIIPSDNRVLRMGETGATESKTNAIDRAVADLMFTHRNFNYKDNEELAEQMDCSVSWQQNSCCDILANIAGDAEVPDFGQCILNSIND